MARFSSKRSQVINRRWFESSIFPGQLIRLRDGVFKRLNDREWLFNKFENDLVFLVHSSRAYGIAVKTEDIDWKDKLP